MTPEGKIKSKLNRALAPLAPYVWRFMPVQNGMGAPGLDYFLCVAGYFIAVETKAPGKDYTPRQLVTKAAIEAAGGIVLKVNDTKSHDAAIGLIIKYLGSRYGGTTQTHVPQVGAEVAQQEPAGRTH